MAALFEKFILNFYRREQTQFGHVWSEGIYWQDTSASESDMAFLPQMRTDVSLQSSTRKIVLDAKYYREATQQRFASDKVRSGHLYQLFAYLRNIHRASPNSAAPEGILLYPLVDKPLDLRFRLHGHAVRVKTIDLTAEWIEIHDELLALLDPAAAPNESGNVDVA